MKKEINPFIGTWSIMEMEAWDQEYVNMEVPGHFTFKKNGTGLFQFGLVQGEMDGRMDNYGGRERIEFSWEGRDELDSASGRGWAVIENGKLCGRIFIHMGEDSAFRARKPKSRKITVTGHTAAGIGVLRSGFSLHSPLSGWERTYLQVVDFTHSLSTRPPSRTIHQL